MDAADLTAGDSMALLEAKAAKMAAAEESAAKKAVAGLGGAGGVSFVRGEVLEEDKSKETIAAANPEEIDIGDIGEDEEEEEEAEAGEDGQPKSKAPRSFHQHELRPST